MPFADDQRKPAQSKAHVQCPIPLPGWPVPTFLRTTLSLTRLSLTLQPFPVPSGSPAPVPSTSSKGPPSSLLGRKSGSPWSFPLCFPCGLSGSLLKVGLLAFLFLLTSSLTHSFAWLYKSIAQKNPVPAGIVYQWKTWPSQGRLGSTSSTKTPGSQPPSPLLPSSWGTLANTQHCNP